MRIPLLMLSCVFALGQTFEVVSIKPSRDMMAEPHRVSCEGGRFLASGQLVGNVLQWAYGLQPLQVAGSKPSWFADMHDTYDIEAKAAAAVSEDECKRMAQAVFVDRFALKFHHETKDMPVYALTIGKNGPKMRALKASGEAGSVVYNGVPGRNPDGQLANGWSMQDLAHEISGLPSLDGRLVVDRTGLKGLYAVKLEFQLFATPGDQQRPDIRTAVEEQLGLKLESARAPVEMFVIDRLERPQGN